MDKILRKIISLTVFFFLMYYAYNIFIPEQGIMKKDYRFVKSQANIVEFESLVKSSGEKDNAGFHLIQGLPNNEAKPRFACDNCHSDYPHKKGLRARAFYNMHSFRISCLTCHIDKKDKKKVAFGWFDDSGNKKPLGTDNPFLRIAPYVKVSNLKSCIENQIKDHDELSKIFEINISRGKGISCNSCHAIKGKLYLDLSSLGYKDEEINKLRNLDETTMFKKDAKWTYPDFL